MQQEQGQHLFKTTHVDKKKAIYGLMNWIINLLHPEL